MANIAKLIFGVAIAAASMASSALAAHGGKPISAYQNGYVTRASQGSGVHNCVPTPSCPGLPSCDPCSGISYPGGEPGGHSRSDPLSLTAIRRAASRMI